MGKSTITEVRGIRAPYDFWEITKKVAKSRKITRNELIVRIVSEYCKKALDK